MQSARETQLLRAFVDNKTREIQQAERAYDLHAAARLLAELARPLTHPTEFHGSWKAIYVDQFYRDVVKFLFSFVAVHLLPGFTEAQRTSSFDAFFDPLAVPVASSIRALVAQITATKPQSGAANDAAADEAALVLSHSVRLLKNVLDDENHGVRLLVDQLIHDPATQTTGRALATVQPLVSSLCSVPDLVSNRLQRATPSFFAPRHFHLRLCEQLLDALLDSSAVHTSTASSAVVFRAFTEKLVRIGAMEHLVRAWLSREDLYDSSLVSSHANLVNSLPASAYEAFLIQLASTASDSPVSSGNDSLVVSGPQYRLLSLLPQELSHNKQFQYVVAQKLLLAKPVRDFVFLRMLVDVLCRSQDAQADDLPLASIFDALVNRWSADSFPLTADFALNASISLFIRYAMTRVDRDVFAAKREWTMKLCKGVQAHMAHSVERVRLLGMRMGESVSKIMSPEQPLDFEIAEADIVDVVGRIVFDFTKVKNAGNESDQAEAARHEASASGSTSRGVPGAKAKPAKSSKKTKGLAFVDPDELVDSDDEDDTEEHDDGSDSDSDSDVSLEAFDMNDDEEDLKAQRPVYIKDLLAGLHAEDDRDKTETALADAESLLRRKPKDLHFSAKAVVTALLRIEDKYDTPNFVVLRAKALAAACALSPSNAVPYLQKQALEKEQLLQSRLDVLQAMTAAAQELSETGVFRPTMAKSLLHEDIESRTMQGLKTRRFGYRRDPLAPAKKNAFADHALAFFSPLLFGYVEYARQLEATKRLSEVEDVFLAHLLHALSSFVECAGHAPPAVPMAKCLMEFAWHYRANNAAAVRRQVLYAFSRVVVVMPPFLLRQELGQNVIDMMAWLQDTNKKDPDEGCREASRLLLSSGVMPMLTM